MPTSPLSVSPTVLRRRVALASFVGTTVEKYDFILYSAAAAVVFPKLFFTELDPLLGTIASFATLAAGYFAGPLGALICGHFGDRIGRKSMLMLTMTMMGVGSTFIGLLPTYDMIGGWAPILLVLARILQGIAVGGEWGGSVLISVEHSRPERRGLFGGFTQMGGPAGGLLAALFLSAMSTLPDEQFLAWGWRVPFLASIVLVGIGMYIRSRVTESPEFVAAKEGKRTAEKPVRHVLTGERRALLIGIAIAFGGLVVHSILSTYMLSYTAQIGYDTTTVFNIKVLMTATALVGTLAFAAASDRFGKGRIVGLGAVCVAVLAFPFFAMVNSGSPLIGGTALVIMLGVVHPMLYAPIAALLSELFSDKARYTGVALSFQVASTIGAGLAPLIAAGLLAVAGGGTNSHFIATFMIVSCAVTVIGLKLTGAHPTARSSGRTSDLSQAR